MAKNFDVGWDELVDVLTKRAARLKTVRYDLPLESHHAIANVQEALDEYKARAEKYQKEHPIAHYKK